MNTKRTLPSDVASYSKTSVFTAETLPDKLKNAHETKAGTWGQLTVNRGEVSYFLEGEDQPLARVTEGDSFIIIPEERHYVRSSDDAEFFVEFCK